MQATGTPHVVLYFDINGTITLKDKSKKVSDEYMIISTLAENTFARWDESQQTPISFKDHVYTHLLPGPKSDAALKKERQKVIAGFFEWLKVNKPELYDSAKKDFDNVKASSTDSAGNFKIFDSFYSMLEKLREENISFSVVLRTFGTDGDDVVEEIQKHPQGVKFSNSCSFSKDAFHLRRGYFVNGVFWPWGEKVTGKVDEIFQDFLQKDVHSAVQDDWTKWNKAGEVSAAGKPFIFDSAGLCNGVRNVAVFFDDNMPNIISPQDIRGVMPPEAVFEKTAFCVNTLEALNDSDYFYKRVRIAMQSIAPQGV